MAEWDVVTQEAAPAQSVKPDPWKVQTTQPAQKPAAEYPLAMRGEILPLGRTGGGKLVPAVPGVIKDPFDLFYEAIHGKTSMVANEEGVVRPDEASTDRAINAGMFGLKMGRLPGSELPKLAAAAPALKTGFEVAQEIPIAKETKTSAVSPEMAAAQHPIPKSPEVPAVPPKPLVQGVSDDLFKLRQNTVADRAEISNYLDKMPEQFRTPEVQERWYHAMENPKAMEKMAPEERQAFTQFVEPMRKELSDLYAKVKQYGYPVEDDTYVHRVVKGHAPTYDSMSGDAYNPIVGTKSLPQSTSALKGRKFFALEDAQGVRHVVSQGGDGVRVWNDGKPTKLNVDELTPGAQVEAGGKRWTAKQATTQEIEGNTPVKYYKNATVNTADALSRMRQVSRNIDYLEELKKSPKFLNYARRVDGNSPPPRGWKESKLPQLRGWVLEPKLRAAFDDFYKPGVEGLEGLRKINQFATASIFWQPLPHIENVAAHWFVGRGWDWIKPRPIRHFANDAGRAIRAVVTQNEDYQKLLRQGSGLVYGGIKNGDFYQAMAKRFGMEIEKDQERWGALRKVPGFDQIADKTAWWYKQVNKVLWQTGDMFMAHRVFELERKGMSTAEAIKEAEKHIPNYRIPTEVVGSRTFSNIMQEPALTIFSRYHYGMWKSYTNMLGDLAKGTGKEKLESIGNLAALGFLMYMVYPAIDYAIQKITGDSSAKKLRRGAASVPSWVQEMYNGDMQFPQFLSNVITMAPATKEMLQQGSSYDFFTGKQISPSDGMRSVVERGEHAANALVNPYAVVNQFADERPGARDAVRAVFDMAIGAKNTSDRTLQGREYGKKLRERESKKRQKQPKGLIEKGYNALVGTDE
jgi:hypothetical protein